MFRMTADRSIITFAIGGLALMTSATAHAQIWIGQIVGDMMAQGQAAQQEYNCMTGTAMPPSEIEETRASAETAIKGYWQAVQGGKETNVAPFYQTDRKAAWVSGAKTVPLSGLIRITDPFASDGAVLDAQPIAYLRAGDGGTVRGQWAARRADGTLIGTYDAMFKRASGIWKLSRLTLIPSTDYAEPVVQFCHKPNDVLPYRLVSTEQTRAYTAKRAEKLRIKADKAKAEADRAAAAAQGKDSSAALLLVNEKKQRASDAEAKAGAAADAARAAVEANELAKTDAATAETTKAAALAELAKAKG
ncbi:hypothetical protein G4G27_11650 [Sphingomonas sp. So64.6b]|uniref:hypothetical protein n=1 Tax=Sphingomonas sp. So64.6b TaxID=2997354 RepID=UPI0016001DAF|nr:hypothetical protein [Sphingomonas sp. So64.6b]QNA84572.1 hypothetical protein G4G27_11650 [Sphingomonas sp. So64.6b]